MSILNFENFVMLQESVTSFTDDFDEIVTEGIAAALGNPIKFMKIKKAAKMYQQALVQKQLNDLDFEKKKAKGTLDPKQKEVLAQANKAKNSALSDKYSAIAQQMDDLATTDGLKQVVKLAKSKAKLAAAEIALKSAGDEESAALKVRIKKLNTDTQEAQKALSDYEKDTKKREPKTKQDTTK